MRDLETIKAVNTDVMVFASNTAVHEVMYVLLNNNIPFKVMLGMYKGEREVSFTVPREHLETIVNLGLLDGQESILVLGAAYTLPDGAQVRPATIVYFDSVESVMREEKAGSFRAVSRMDAESATGYTYDPQSGMFYTIVADPVQDGAD